MQAVPNVARLTECRLLSDSAAINISLPRSDEIEETIRFHRRRTQSPVASRKNPLQM